ncbi:hypothetical protein [Chelativorans alearense]|uniref:hypothetical protein n=1 Tax=Chelativorans alearense TaxID=2681495 RepID=UPI0013D37440|nr:hypothetical protein [Chelativorans alearense]
MNWIENHFEAAKQIAFADRIVLTKSDPTLIRDIESLRARLTSLNPATPIDNSHQDGFDPAALFQRRVYAPASPGDDVIGWLALEDAIRGDGGHGSAKLGASPFARQPPHLQSDKWC